MYAKHFFKMLIGLVGMGLIGVVGLVFSNHYAKDQAKAPTASGSSLAQPLTKGH